MSARDHCTSQYRVEWLDDYEIISGNNAERDKAVSRVTTIVFGRLDSDKPQKMISQVYRCPEWRSPRCKSGQLPTEYTSSALLKKTALIPYNFRHVSENKIMMEVVVVVLLLLLLLLLLIIIIIIIIIIDFVSFVGRRHASTWLPLPDFPPFPPFFFLPQTITQSM